MQKKRIKRFTPLQIVFHLALMLCFMVLSATGLARMYVETAWGQQLANIFGGYHIARTVHLYAGYILIIGFIIHSIYLLFKIDWRNFPGWVLGPYSLYPKWTDIKDFFRHIGFLLGLAEQPAFDRWGYWEKFDYWAVFWGMIVIGITGLMLAFPFVSTSFLPGWALNVAFWVHRIEAILAIAHVFIIHLFIGHLRRSHFPMDRAMFEGSADLEAVSHERPAWISRLQQEGRLDGLLTEASGPAVRIASYVVGYMIVVAGLYLLIGGIINSTRIHW